MMTSSGCRSRSNSTTTGGGVGSPGGVGVVVCDTGNNYNNNTNSSSTFTNNMKQHQQQTMKRPTSSISLLADQLKLSSLNEQDPCSTTMRMMSMMTTKPVGQYDVSCDCPETINEVRIAYSMPTHSHIGIHSSKRNNNDNNHTTIGNSDWTRSAASGSGSTSKDYNHHHHSRTVHFRDIFTPSSSVCSSLQSTVSEFDDGGNEMTNPDHNSCCFHVLSASAPTTNYSLNSMSNLSKCNETTSCHHNVITNSNNNNSASTTTTNTTNNSIPSSNCTFNLFSSSFPCSKDKIDNMNIISPNTHIAHNHPHHHHHHQHSSCTASKTMFSSLSSSSNCCGCCCYCSCSISSTGVSGSSGIGGGSGSNNSFTFCPTSYYSCSCYVCRINNQSQHPGVGAAAGSSTLASSSQYCLPAKRACRSTSSSSDLPYYTSSLLSSSSSVCGYYSYHRQCHLPQRHCHQCCPKSIINNNNNATMIRSMQSYIKNLPRPIAVRLDSQTMMAYNTKSKSCTNMDHVKSLNPINSNSNNNDDDDGDIDSNSSTLRNNNSNNNNGVILRPKPSDFMSFNKTGNGSRLSWHHPLFSFSSVSSQVKYNNTNSNNNAISNPSTVPNDTSSGDSQLIMSADNSQPPVQKSIRLRNHHTTRANEQQQQRTTSVRPPNYIEIKELQDSSLSAHALPSPSSAFTPTRASFGSFPIDVNSSSFSLSPATGGSISSVQMTARTPSSGFHEASFSGLSEASSLPDCSRFGVPSDSMPHTSYCHCQCHQHQRPHLHLHHHPHHHAHHDHHHRHHHHHHHHHHSGRKNHGKMSIDDDKKFSSNLYTHSSNQLTDLEPCFKLEENEFNMNNDNNKNNHEELHQTMRNISSSGSNSSHSSNDSNSSSCSLQSMKCTLRCCSQPNDNTIYDNMNYKHLIHCSNNSNNNDGHVSKQNNYRSLCTPLACTSLTPTTANTTNNNNISSNNGNNNNNTNQSTPSSAMTTTGLKRRRGPSGECTECFDELHDNNNYNNSHEEDKEQIHDDIFPCGCYYWKRSTDQVHNNNNDDHLRNISSALLNTTLNDNNNHPSSNCRLSTTVCCSCHELQHSLFSFSEHYPTTSIYSSTSSSYSSRHLCMPETCVHQDDPTLIEADFINNTDGHGDGNADDEQNTSTLIKRCTHSNTMPPINVDYNDSNSNNNNNTETMHDYCPMELINPCHIGSHEDTIKCNPCNIVNYGQECEYSSGVFFDDSFPHNHHHHQHQHAHRYTCSELGKLSEMIEDEKEHETPETMIDEGGICGSNHVSEVNWHHPEISLTSPPSIHDITFTPICPPSPPPPPQQQQQLLSTGIPVHNRHHDEDDVTGRQVILFTPSPIDGSNFSDGGESEDIETILSPQMPNRQRIFSDFPINESNNSNNNNDNNNNISGNDNNNDNSSKQISSSFIDLDLELIEND